MSAVNVEVSPRTRLEGRAEVIPCDRPRHRSQAAKARARTSQAPGMHPILELIHATADEAVIVLAIQMTGLESDWRQAPSLHVGGMASRALVDVRHYVVEIDRPAP